MRGQTVLAAAALALGSACRTEATLIEPDPHLERMVTQEKVLAYGVASALPNGMAMQAPPEGTRPVALSAGDPAIETGVRGGRYTARIPIRLDRALIERGRDQFDVFCATCHGALGDGESIVATKMSLRKPPSLHLQRLRDAPAGQIFRTVREGYGLMPAYVVQLSAEDTWGVVAYVRALQLARNARVADLPVALRAQLLREAP